MEQKYMNTDKVQ